MKITLPILEKEIKDGQLIKNIVEKDFELDTSLVAQIRFESKFPDLAAREDLWGYSKRICAIDTLSAPILLSKMKTLYCFFDTDLEFVDFLKLFDLSDLEYIKKISKSIGEAFDIVLAGSAEKN